MAGKNKTPSSSTHPEAVIGGLIINNDGEIFLARSRKCHGKYAIIGGHVELGEKLRDAVIREVKEEAGIDVKVIREIGFGEVVFSEEFYKGKHMIFLDFLCRYEGGKDAIELNDEHEDDYLWISPEEALKMDLAGKSRQVIENYLKLRESEGYLEGWKRCQADFENYKRRQTESQKDLLRYSAENMILQVLPVIDNFRSATEHVPEDQKDDAWVKGIMYIQKQLGTVLSDNGVEEIDAKIGDEFDPNIHEAVESNNDKQTDKDKISKVVLKGYRMGDKVIRAARVVVE